MGALPLFSTRACQHRVKGQGLAGYDRINKEMLNYWDAVSDAAGIQQFSAHTELIECAKWSHLQRYLKESGGRSLEVGCGSGHVSALLAQKGYEAILLDYSVSALQCARNSFLSYENRAKKRFVLGDALSLPFRDGAVDVVLSCGLIEHFEDPRVPIHEMIRVLRPGGLFYSDICPRKFTLIGALDFLYPKVPAWHEAKMDKRQIRQMMGNAGLEEVHIFSAGVLPPRSIPGSGRIKAIGMFSRWVVERFSRFWVSMDGTVLADWMGLYYFVTGSKRIA